MTEDAIVAKSIARSHLIVNPYAAVSFRDNEQHDCIATSPKPGSGLQILDIKKSERPRLHQLFEDLSQMSLDALDVDRDLSETDRELLYRHGILIDKGDAFQKQLFSCALSDVEAKPAEEDLSSLIVNPTFRYEPFNLQNFRTWATELHLSPYQPSAWVSSPVADIDSGYWLSPDEAAVISTFTAGEKPVLPGDHKLIRRCIEAGILVSAGELSSSTKIWNERLDRAAKEFSSDKYTIVPSLFPPAQMAAMRSFYRGYVEQGFMPFGDPQVERRYRQHNEPFASFLHKKLTKLMSIVVGEEAKPSYVYAASYKEGSVLKPHTDREQCEFSISFQVDYQPESPDQLSPWGIYVEPLEHNGDLSKGGLSFDQNKMSPDAKAIYLASGDGLIYKGRELIHYRHALPEGHKSTSLFFHYVAAGFDGVLT